MKRNHPSHPTKVRARRRRPARKRRCRWGPLPKAVPLGLLGSPLLEAYLLEACRMLREAPNLEPPRGQVAIPESEKWPGLMGATTPQWGPFRGSC